jgi:hypothetical protein
MEGNMKATAQETTIDPQNSQQLAQRQRPTQSKGTTATTQLALEINASPRVESLAQLRQQIHQSPRLSAQLQGSRCAGAETPVQTKPKEEKLQAKPKEELRQRRAEDSASSPGTSTEAASSGSASGLPPQLKSGVESLSGMSMDNVQVHYNSAKPAQLNALAYAQGSDIHVGPGQEQHLPHEAWHVVQQAQGRVQTTKQLKGGVAINDDKGLEHEADVKGRQAMQAAGRGMSTSKSVRAAHTSAALQRRGVVQGVFTGFNGGGWALDNSALPGAMNTFPGGGNNAGGGKQAGATARTIDVASRSAYAAPQKLGGFNHFSGRYTNKILQQPGGKAKRYTHLHVINGKTHGPGAPNNLTLGSTADNNQHRAQVEDFIRDGLPAANTASTYHANLLANPPSFVHAGIAYWTKGANPVNGSVANGGGATVTVAGVKKNFARSADPNAKTQDRRWAHYTVAPNYGVALSPTIRANIAGVYQGLHQVELNVVQNNWINPLPALKQVAPNAHLLNAKNALNGQVTAANLAGGVNATLTAGNNAAYPHVKKAVGAPNAVGYKANMAAELADMDNFGQWAQQAFPATLVCDADLYKASFNAANPWRKRTEAQTTIPINTN